MIRKSFILVGVLGLFAAAIAMRPSDKGYNIDEVWLEKTYPNFVAGFSMQPGDDGSPMHSYKMDKLTYQALKPYGIVGRVLSDGKNAYDVVVLAGDEPDTFHNPLACFKSQEWTVVENKEITLNTKSRGPVHATLAKATKGGQMYSALYTFEGPSNTFSSNAALHGDLFWKQLFTGRIQPATFFRFMTLNVQQDDSQIKRFATEYLDASPVRPIMKS